MKFVYAVLLVMALAAAAPAYADVWIPDNEYSGYFSSQDVYTVVGAVKNTESFAVRPTVSIDLVDDGKPITVSHVLPVVYPNKDIPFRITVHGVSSDNVELKSPKVTYDQVQLEMTRDIQVLYDKSLVRHEDGHLTGRIVNNGTQTEYDVKVYALIHGSDHRVLDVGINLEKIEKIEPGQIVEFTMYPDPQFSSMVSYYSCFAIGDETIVPMKATRNGKTYDFRYDSTASFTVVGFNDPGTELSIYGINSFKLPTYVNFEFPMTSTEEDFDVTVDGEPVQFIQSIDEMGNWHVAFEVGPSSQNDIVISGFANAPQEQRQVEQVPVSGLADGNLSLLYAIPVIVGAAIGLYVVRRKRKVSR